VWLDKTTAARAMMKLSKSYEEVMGTSDGRREAPKPANKPSKPVAEELKEGKPCNILWVE